MKHLKAFEQYNIINEKLTDVNEDVDMIYDTYFKDGYDYINEFDKIDISLFKTDTITSAELVSPACKKAHLLNPIKIYINNADISHISNNFYNPFDKIISIRVNNSAIEYANDFESVSDAADNLTDSQKNSFLNEFKGSSIKGSIHHELAHWIDDTLNNQHLKKKLQKQKETGVVIKNINFSPMELQAQIHNIVQLKRKYEKIWDDLTFEEMIKLSSSLSSVMKRNDDYDARKDWIFRLKKRMARENLLGKKMYYK